MSSQVPPEVGAWGYAAGTSGTRQVPDGAQVLGITCHSAAGGSFTINGGDSIPVPANVGIDVAPRGNLIAPLLVFTATDAYFIEWVE